MAVQFVNCPSCGTRNFKDDKVCGVCKHEFSGKEKSLQEKSNVNLHIRWKIVLLTVGLAVFAYLFITNNYNENLKPEQKSIVANSVSEVSSSGTNTDLTISYSIEEALINNAFCRITVRLDKKISQLQIKLLSNKIKQEVKCTSDKVRIFFLLPEMIKGNGAWSRVDLDYGFDIMYYGPSLEDELAFKANKQTNRFDIIGQWIDNSSPGGFKGVGQRIRYNGKRELILEYFSIDEPNKEGPLPILLKKVKKNGTTFYVNIDEGNPGEYFIIQEDGDLACYDNQGLIVVLKKV